ncbi:gastrula zinc finger protein XlCGF57.1-like [Poecilia reticulata]|uniref:Gastrula zinc finger protein XlCGF57.1-like n=1 Tax=Poecilia reticulata TaxID=8081 RepID=A0A3P9PQ25_POERE|nr:PREDICTED: gastrula zinc finger protein XlCGF57.1-like [Poecilia reticulata]
MSRLQSLKVFVSQRLSAAVEDILGHLEETILEYEEETERRHRDFLDVILTAEMKHRKAGHSDVQQMLMKLHSEQQQQLEKSSTVDQEEPKSLQFKREQEEVEITNMFSGSVHVKTEEQEVETQSSELHDSQTEEIVIILEEDDGEEPETGVGYTNPDLMAPRTDPGDEECDVIQDHENPLNDIGSNVLNSFRCSECGKRFGSLSYLKLHIRCHTGDRPFRCPVCRKCFSWRGRLQKHMRIHTGEKPFRCSVCGRRFSESGNLKVHMRIHTGEKPFSCAICGKSYTQRGNLNMHMAVHKGDSIIKCSLHQSQQLRHHSQVGASRNFVKRQKLAPQEDLKAGSNLRVDESGSGKVHVNCTGCSTCKKHLNCSVCGKIFGFKGQLKAHMRCHTGEKPYKCPICWKCFSWNGCLQKHVKIHTGEKPYECTVCGKGFIESGNLKVHMRIHTGEKPFSCPVCGRRYRQKGGLTKHLEVHQDQK